MFRKEGGSFWIWKWTKTRFGSLIYIVQIRIIRTFISVHLYQFMVECPQGTVVLGFSWLQRHNPSLTGLLVPLWAGACPATLIAWSQLCLPRDVFLGAWKLPRTSPPAPQSPRTSRRGSVRLGPLRFRSTDRYPRRSSLRRWHTAIVPRLHPRRPRPFPPLQDH